MKNTILTLVAIFFFAHNTIAQVSATEQIKREITKKFNKWLLKTDFETNTEYEKRVQSNSEETLKKIAEETTLLFKKDHLKNIYFSLGRYNAEQNYFELGTGDTPDDYHLENTFRPFVPSIILPVNKIISKYIKQNFITYHSKRIIPIDAEIIEDEWQITKAFIAFSNCYNDMGYFDNSIIESKGDFKLHWNNKWSDFNYDFVEKNLMTLTDSTQIDKKTENCLFYTKWDLRTQPNYTPSESKPISFSLEDLNIKLPETLTAGASNTIAKSQEPDLDISKVQTGNSNTSAVAVVIGNKDYEKTKKVSFAINDASEMKKYLVNALGYSESNIIFIENAKKSNFDVLFGTNDNPEGRLYNTIKQGESDVFIYYSGHGAPGLKDNKGYFVPIDCEPNYLEQTGYSLDLFYKNIAKLNAKSVTVVTDACFSGAEIFKNISPITITISNPIAVMPNCVVMSSSTGSQVSSWFNEKNHGLFTYFFLRAMQDKDKADVNKDNKLSFKEIANYVSDKTEGVPSLARRLHNVDQNPTVQGTGVDNIFVEYK